MESGKGHSVSFARAAGIVTFLWVVISTIMTQLARDCVAEFLVRVGNVALPRITDWVLYRSEALWGIPCACLASLIFAWCRRSPGRMMVHLTLCCGATFFFILSCLVLLLPIVRMSGK